MYGLLSVLLIFQLLKSYEATSVVFEPHMSHIMKRETTSFYEAAGIYKVHANLVNPFEVEVIFFYADCIANSTYTQPIHQMECVEGCFNFTPEMIFCFNGGRLESNSQMLHRLQHMEAATCLRNLTQYLGWDTVKIILQAADPTQSREPVTVLGEKTLQTKNKKTHSSTNKKEKTPEICDKNKPQYKLNYGKTFDINETKLKLNILQHESNKYVQKQVEENVLALLKKILLEILIIFILLTISYQILKYYIKEVIEILASIIEDKFTDHEHSSDIDQQMSDEDVESIPSTAEEEFIGPSRSVTEECAYECTKVFDQEEKFTQPSHSTLNHLITERELENIKFLDPYSYKRFLSGDWKCRVSCCVSIGGVFWELHENEEDGHPRYFFQRYQYPEESESEDSS